jgi:class 3 adenylate cyclase
MSRFAAAALSAAAATPIDPAAPGLGAVLLRVGLHSGPCSAGVVGRDHPKFTLFGDTVNTAARMEQTSAAGRAQCSAATATLIRAQDPAIKLLPRGTMEVKGKGAMETFWIEEAGADGVGGETEFSKD